MQCCSLYFGSHFCLFLSIAGVRCLVHRYPCCFVMWSSHNPLWDSEQDTYLWFYIRDNTVFLGTAGDPSPSGHKLLHQVTSRSSTWDRWVMKPLIAHQLSDKSVFTLGCTLDAEDTVWQPYESRHNRHHRSQNVGCCTSVAWIWHF